MPELPEVEAAATVARGILVGRRLLAVTTHHASQRRSLPPRHAARLAGLRIVAVERRGKSQLVHFAGGAVLLVHFRMTGDWEVAAAGAPMPAYTRIAFATDDGVRLCLVDARALCTATYHAPGEPPRITLGPEPDQLTVAALRTALARRAGPVKPALLDQKVVAGLGNIYAAEALWRARIDPRTPARDLGAAQLAALVKGIKAAITDGFARQGRYRDGTRAHAFKVYDREGLPCRRGCGVIARITQAGRSTYFCPGCQC
ncbi:MAG: Fpg/Nei family DNA glycosylase [Gemmatimonadaceae bacterium]